MKNIFGSLSLGMIKFVTDFSRNEHMNKCEYEE